SNGDIAPGWPAKGIVLRPLGTNTDNPYIVPDGAGGGFITFQASDGPGAIAAMHVTNTGVVDWDTARAPSESTAFVARRTALPASDAPNHVMHRGDIEPF